MPRPKTGSLHYYAQLRLPDKGLAIYWMDVCKFGCSTLGPTFSEVLMRHRVLQLSFAARLFEKKQKIFRSDILLLFIVNFVISVKANQYTVHDYKVIVNKITQQYKSFLNQTNNYKIWKIAGLNKLYFLVKVYKCLDVF